ncbi:nitrobenzoate reductase [Burkholderia sp. Nafp2/4-1b]|uniref:nitroreductase n=1 Tax=Burkholderia sp. Nafp2/4-1b TaxID=2116686 RepID=UPI000EF87D9A|nr:nitroreductase [Burkholderia sp. Nafp2/4-1b]RKU00171.1 nitrobenzoate reductase [Burkholderia sp. Nafp2/4-1b]
MERVAAPPDELSAIRSAVEWAIATRRSVRAYLPTPVPEETINAILDVARYAATGVNIQPWKVHVVTGAARDRVCNAIKKVDADPSLADMHADEWNYYPNEWVSPYIDRRRALGWTLYGLLGIRKEDKPRMREQHGRNYQFFDAPVGLFFTIDRVMQQGSLLDYGMFLQNIMIVARTYGISTCPQAAFMKYHKIVEKELGLGSEEMFLIGMSVGYADESRIENALVSERAPCSSFTVHHTT